MSSFVVSKQEFIKAAGLMNGLEGSKRDSHKYFVDNVRELFVNAYELNVKSVNEQYNDDSLPDGNDYDGLFKQYQKKGEKLYFSKVIGEDSHFKEIRKGLMVFFRSVLYQIENEKMHQEVAELFLECAHKLYQEDYRDIDGWWGSIDC